MSDKKFLLDVLRISIPVALQSMLQASFSMVDTGLSAARLMIADKNRWQGELTPEVITNTVESSKSGDWQSTSDINYLASDMLVGEFFQRNFNTRRAPCSFPQGMDGAKLYAPKYLPG